MKHHQVYLYYAPECIRKWLAYTTNQGHETTRVKIIATSGAKAKNAAITSANKRFSGVEVLYVNDTGDRTAIGNYPELHYMRAFAAVGGAERAGSQASDDRTAPPHNSSISGGTAVISTDPNRE